ncbi:ornithine/lysine decarboxylase DokD [Vibrio panuliri]|uniref:Diaminopimelate decarboxylase n=1 Tax=Vibrio panuliri TaxID=1381081 RepID=A0ABX3FAW6_9VIBR|nr:diaminopimelate decarboxylase [Vibrio panuliri]KAB1458999.1 diaminopimelate decarboxylase [Vibrio panuliri]OLQ86661.1 diaminopimelate decarboxylase [Vibrio panuliri]
MSDFEMNNFNLQREKIIDTDRRFKTINNKLHFEGVELESLAKKYGTPLYVYSEHEIVRNIREIAAAFSAHKNTKTFFASKACSVMSVLKAIKDAGIYAEANSMYEVRKCLEVGFPGSQIVFNGVVKKPVDLEFAIANDLYLINVDSIYELDHIDAISRRLEKVANVCVRVEPNVPSATHAELVTAYHAKSGLDLEQAEETCRRILEMPFVSLKGLHMHVGDQVPEAEPFAKATKVMVDECRRLEEKLGIQFELINVGGGIPTPYKYDEENGNPLEDNMYAGITSQDFADAIISEVHKWREDIAIVIEPGRKVVGSAAVLLTEVSCEKTKTFYDLDGNVEQLVDWTFVDAGYSQLSDSQHFSWFFYVFNASKVAAKHDKYVKLAGPLCDGGDYFHVGVKDEFFAVPHDTEIGDVMVFLDAGAYTIESQTVYNNRPRTAVVMIDKDGTDRLIRREDTYEDIVGQDIY